MKTIEIASHQKNYPHPLAEGPRIKNFLVEPGLARFDNAKIDGSKIFLPNPSIFVSPCLSAYPLAVPTPTTSITPPFSFPADAIPPAATSLPPPLLLCPLPTLPRCPSNSPPPAVPPAEAMRRAQPAAAAARRCGSRDPRGGGVAWMLHNSGAYRCRDRRPFSPRCRPTGGGVLLPGAVAVGGAVRALPSRSPSMPPRPRSPPRLVPARRHGLFPRLPCTPWRSPPPRPPPMIRVLKFG